MKTLKVSRGALFLCDVCYQIIEEEGQVQGEWAKSDAVVDDLCPNCHDYNKPLIDDLKGSSE